jgi:hypothetical protein
MFRGPASTALFVAVLASAPAFGAPVRGAASATAESGKGPSIGLRFGWGLPLGSRIRRLRVTEPMGPGKEFSGLVPIWFDAGYRFSKLVYVGGYFQYAFLLVPDRGCPAPIADCSAHDVRGGANVHFHFLPDRRIGPWLGAGIGYEASTITFALSDQSATRSNGGFEFVNLQAGVDIRSPSGIRWGPFTSFSFDEYLTETQTTPNGSSETYSLSGPNSAPTLHYFAVMGIRAQLDL